MTVDAALRLQKPSPTQRAAFMRLLDEYERAGERFRHGRIHEQARLDFQSYVAGLRDSARGSGLRPGWVPHTMYWLMSGEEIAGETTLRHFLTPELRNEGGHIGYRITPSFRRRGYGTRLLALMLAEARAAGLPRVLVTCDSDNMPSAKIIRANGGAFAGESTSNHSGKAVSRYWITLHPTLAARDGVPQEALRRRQLDELTLFVTRGQSLLVIEERGGIALPTGIANRDESISNAAWRTLYTQTGLAQLRLVDILAQRRTALDDGLRFVLATSALTQLPAGRTLSGRLRRATPVNVLARQGAYAQVIHTELVVDANGRSRTRAQISGWLPAPLLATTHVRHFLHLSDQGSGSASWHHRTAERRLRLFWAPIDALSGLSQLQQSWVAKFRSRL